MMMMMMMMKFCVAYIFVLSEIHHVCSQFDRSFFGQCPLLYLTHSINKLLTSGLTNETSFTFFFSSKRTKVRLLAG